MLGHARVKARAKELDNFSQQIMNQEPNLSEVGIIHNQNDNGCSERFLSDFQFCLEKSVFSITLWNIFGVINPICSGLKN